MNLLGKFLAKNYQYLKIFLILLVILTICILETYNYYHFHKSIANILLDSIVSLVFTIILVSVIFYIINIKQKQLNDQLDQLTEAYQYIGQVNRKIDALLELDISSLDHSKSNSLHESSAKIFKQLINILPAKAGFFHLKPPQQFKIYHGEQINPEIKKTFDYLHNQGITDFRYSHGPENEAYFKELGVNENLLKKYIFLIKPIYMHDQDIGHIILVFPKNRTIEDRDINIIRIYSFYLALNYTFKPDLSLYQKQLE